MCLLLCGWLFDWHCPDLEKQRVGPGERVQYGHLLHLLYHDILRRVLKDAILVTIAVGATGLHYYRRRLLIARLHEGVGDDGRVSLALVGLRIWPRGQLGRPPLFADLEAPHRLLHLGQLIGALQVKDGLVDESVQLRHHLR